MMLQSRAENLVYRLLMLDPPAEKVESTLDDAAPAERAFGFSLIFSGVRCVLQYVILPFVLPVIGVTIEAAVPLVLAINIVAVFFILYSVRRFWEINYKYKWQYLPLAFVALIILGVFIALDMNVLLGGPPITL